MMGEGKENWNLEEKSSSGWAAGSSGLSPYHVTGGNDSSPNNSSLPSGGESGSGGVVAPPTAVTDDGRDLSSSDVSHRTGYLDILTEHINRHLRAYRAAAWGVGSVGVVLLLWFSRVPLRRYRQVSDIPADYVAANRKLSGVVAATKWNTIGVWHVPGWRRVLRYETVPPKNCPEEELLTVQFSGVLITHPSARVWLKQNLLGRRVWLRLLDHTSPAALDQKAVQCAVYIRKKGLLRWGKACVNKDLLMSGIGSITEVSGFASNADRADFLSGLIKSEKAAKSRGQGVWQGTEHVTMWNRIRNYFRRT